MRLCWRQQCCHQPYCQAAEETIPSQTEERARRPRQEKRETIWSWRVGPDPETIDPALNSASDGNIMIIHLFEPLLNMDKDNNIIGGMAETWDVSEDGLTYTFHLREGLKWSDGTPLTANDFVYTFKRVADPMTAAPYGYSVHD